MLNDHIDRLPPSGFMKLDAMTREVPPAVGLAPINLSIGDPQMTPPGFVVDILVENRDLFGRYSPTGGTAEFRAAASGWLHRRYRLPAGMIDPDRHILPVAGLKEGMFMIALVVVPRAKAGRQPAVLIPNPFYHPYAGAAAGAGAEAVFVGAHADNRFMPDFAGLDEATLARTAAVYLCSPANPQGVAADIGYLSALIRLAREHDFVLVVDECYADIYVDAAPVGALEACAALGGALGGALDNVVVFHSTSKRSSAPGLRSGFVAGDAEILRRYLKLRNYGGVAMPQPVQAASAALWRDDGHADANRAFYARNFLAAERILGNRFGYYRPDGGMFLWLDVGDGEAAARKLWSRAAVKTMPGQFMTREVPGSEGVGAPYIRLALVHDLATTTEALERLSNTL
ncbi:MAG: aminotransferase class I/II-fold pyridoxal phosphate-dependent enzyme [Alphaproteobacteria bacterium]